MENRVPAFYICGSLPITVWMNVGFEQIDLLLKFEFVPRKTNLFSLLNIW